MCDAIRWFKCKLKPPKKHTHFSPAVSSIIKVDVCFKSATETIESCTHSSHSRIENVA